MSRFVKTPAGVVMHVLNHQWFVEQAKRHPERSASMLALLEPAVPVTEAEIFGNVKP